MPQHSSKNLKVLLIGLLIGFLLNVTGWIGNNLLLKNMWKEDVKLIVNTTWRDSIWRDIFSVLPDFMYGIAIVWLIDYLNNTSSNILLNSLKAGVFVSLVGGITTYFAIANSGLISWKLAFASFVLVIITKLPLAIFAGKLLVRKGIERNQIES